MPERGKEDKMWGRGLRKKFEGGGGKPERVKKTNAGGCECCEKKLRGVGMPERGKEDKMRGVGGGGGREQNLRGPGYSGEGKEDKMRGWGGGVARTI